MIDIHSHVLYGVDDGAQSLDETRALLRQAYGQGIKTLIATPHQRKGRFEASRSTIDKHFQDLQTIAREVAPDLTVHLGTEVFYSNSMLDRLEQGQIL
ncbi:CpsB/CapC family capsule biosynthesis tyrosine phosphatase, partial [Abiotrophia sp.]|nr:tyrosine protein phosphatase [Abiotrophia sp.]